MRAPMCAPMRAPIRDPLGSYGLLWSLVVSCSASAAFLAQLPLARRCSCAALAARVRRPQRRLAAPAGEQAWSFFSAGQNFLNLALKRFVAGGQFPERLAEHVRQRQGEILPLLKGAADSGGSVLSDTRLASKLAFDALKSDIYTKGAPKTPQAAKDVAYALVDAAAETRRRYLAFITQSAEAIARDASGQRESASAVTARARIAAMQAKWGGEGPGVTEQVVNL